MTLRVNRDLGCHERNSETPYLAQQKFSHAIRLYLVHMTIGRVGDLHTPVSANQRELFSGFQLLAEPDSDPGSGSPAPDSPGRQVFKAQLALRYE